MEVSRGLRVVRGPDWEGGDQDGGEGFVGTVVAAVTADGAEDGRHDVATVQWDVGGERHNYRCGAQDKYDLRVLDSGAAGVLHAHIECTVCGSESIAGCVWRCLHCLRYYLCTPCYMHDRHSVWHHFVRIDTPQNTNQRTKVRCRYQSRRVPARGVFQGARVVRGHDWRWNDQDGGAGKEGTVLEISGWHSESSRSVAVVEWGESPRKRRYRLGHKGKVDLKCMVAAEYGYCYLDHLPVLGAEYKAPQTAFLCAGEKALIEMDLDLLKSSLDEIKAWDDNIVDYLGKVGLVNSVNLDETEAVLTYSIRSTRFHVVTAALKKVECLELVHDDVVRVIDDMAEVHRLQQAGRGWEDDMALALGQLGRVGGILEDGNVIVRVNGRRWVLDPSCFVPAPGEQPEDELTEVEPSPGLEMLWLSFLPEPSSEMFYRISARGCAKVLADMLKKSPDQVNAKHEGKTLLHVAAAEGRANAVRVLLEHNADITATDKVGETALHNAAYYNHYHVAKVLLDAGSDVNAKGMVGITPVHVTAALGFSRLLGLLLEQPNCKVNAQDIVASTPLHLACQGCWPNIARQLVMARADTSLFDHKAMNVFMDAVLKGFYSGIEVIMQVHPEVINHCKIDDGYTPLHLAARFDHCDIVCYLAAMETCEVDRKNFADQTPLHIASREGHIKSLECLVGYGADVEVTDLQGNTPLHFVLAKKNMKPLSDWTLHLNEVYEQVSSLADNSIQSVPAYITVACFLASEGANLESVSLEGLTPIQFCPPEYLSLLKLFAKPERSGHYKGSLSRHPPPVPIPISPQETKSEAGGTSSGVTTHPQKKTTPTEEMTTPTRDSMSGGNSNKTEESDNPQQPVTSLHNKTQSTSPKNVRVTGSCYLCERPCDICFKPCGHTSMCAACAERVKRCPTCRNDVLQKIKITI